MSSSPPRDNSAQIARQAEEARQARIAQGKMGIDEQFSGFNDDFYNQYQTDYTNYYNPQVDDQYGDAVKKLTLQLAQTGNLTGSVGANQLGDLQKFYDTQKMGIVDRGTNARRELMGNIDAKKSQLYSDNRSSADPGAATSAATAAAQYLQPGAQTSPLANVFSDFFNQLGNQSAIRNAQKINQGTGVQQYSGGRGGTSGYVVNGNT